MADASRTIFKSKGVFGLIFWAIANAIYGAGAAWLLRTNSAWAVLFDLYNATVSVALLYFAYETWKRRYTIEVLPDGSWTATQKAGSTQRFLATDVDQLVVVDNISGEAEYPDFFDPQVRVKSTVFSLHSLRGSGRAAERDLQRFAKALGIEREITHIPQPPPPKKVPIFAV